RGLRDHLPTRVTTSEATIPKAAAPARRSRPRRVILLAVAVVALAGYFGYRAWSARRHYEWSGTVEAREVSVGSRAGGRVKQVLLKEGDRAEAGQALVVLEPGDLDAQKLMG